MKVPYSWLKEYVDTKLTAQELVDKLFGCGFEVEELLDLGAEISRVVVGEVLSCEKVEGTHLLICQVNCGPSSRSDDDLNWSFVTKQYPFPIDIYFLPSRLPSKVFSTRSMPVQWVRLRM